MQVFKQKLSLLKTNDCIDCLEKVSNSMHCFDIALQFWDKDECSYTEQCYALYLNKSNAVIGFAEISRGGTTATVVDVKVILSHALNSAAQGVVLYHNHPSGNLKPSQADMDLTRKVKNACGLLDMVLIDHLIVTSNNNFYSFADEGQI
jgi:DNA repair protein RadC